MISRASSQQRLFDQYVAGSQYKEDISLAKTILCKLSVKIFAALLKIDGLTSPEVWVNTKVLKHIYDDHNPQHKDIIKNLDLIMREPKAVYRNKPGKEGKYLFLRDINRKAYCAVVDVVDEDSSELLAVRTCFYISKPRKYLRGFECIWEYESK
jgi:hypothetical protein